jgi:hypothetical protein
MAVAEEDRPAMTQIEQMRPLRAQLTRLRHRRQRFRWATAASALALALLWALGAVFVLDWCFQRNVDVYQRLLLEGLAAAGVIWAFAKFARPWLGKSEDDAEMALLVQQKAGIDSDLVAALQFESPEAGEWGSRQLETAVIGRVAVEQKDIDVMSAMPNQPLGRRLKWLLATAVIWIMLGLVAPGSVRVFFERLAFGPQHYPSQTRLVAVSVNGKRVEFLSPDKVALHVGCDQAVHFEVATDGTQPNSGRVEISAPAGGPPALVPLEASPSETPPSENDPQAVFRGTFAKLSQPVSYQVFVGDAWTDPLYLSVTPLPAVEIEVEVVPPDYLRRTTGAVLKLARGMRDFSVPAGSEVKLTLDCDRHIAAADVTIAGRSYAMKRDDAPAGEREIWRLATAGTPLAAVAAETRFAIQIHDLEGQTLEHPLEGSIGLEPDLPPTIIATMRSPIVLATGSPTIHYEATDDHALNGIWLTWEAAAGGSSPGPDKREGRIEISRFSPESAPRTRVGDFPLALQSLPLKPGDTLRVTLHASDYRGPAAAATADADPPLVFQVTDVAGFEASMYEADQKSAGALEDIRKKHSGLGDTQ